MPLKNSPIPHECEWDVHLGERWNTQENANFTSAKDFYYRLNAGVATSMEIPYFGTRVHTEDDFKRIGKDLLIALCRQRRWRNQ